jgi:Protein of unknown function (DUF2934)
MLERRTARSAAAKPKAKAATAPKTKATATKTGAQAAAGNPVAPKRRIDEMHEYVQRRAYELWESEGRPTGRDQAHWLQAESEVARARGQRAGMTR